MDANLKKELEEIRKLVGEGKKDDALNKVDTLLEKSEYKPYENALKKIKVDIIYALNLERINSELGKKAYDKVVSELDSVLGNTMKQSAPEQAPPGKPKPLPNTQPSGQGVPIMPVPLVRIEPPPLIKELMERDPYDIDSISIEHEIGPLGFLNDMRRTFVSIFDPLLPIKMLEKETKKTK